MNRTVRITLLLSALWLTGCDMLGLEPASAIAARREAEGKAVGAGCRHAGRAIEDCYAMNRKAEKAAVYAGWREMNDYMTENKIDVVPTASTQSTEVAVQDAGDDSAERAGKKPSKPRQGG